MIVVSDLVLKVSVQGIGDLTAHNLVQVLISEEIGFVFPAIKVFFRAPTLPDIGSSVNIILSWKDIEERGEFEIMKVGWRGEGIAEILAVKSKFLEFNIARRTRTFKDRIDKIMEEVLANYDTVTRSLSGTYKAELVRQNKESDRKFLTRLWYSKDYGVDNIIIPAIQVSRIHITDLRTIRSSDVKLKLSTSDKQGYTPCIIDRTSNSSPHVRHAISSSGRLVINLNTGEYTLREPVNRSIFSVYDYSISAPRLICVPKTDYYGDGEQEAYNKSLLANLTSTSVRVKVPYHAVESGDLVYLYDEDDPLRGLWIVRRRVISVTPTRATMRLTLVRDFLN